MLTVGMLGHLSRTPRATNKNSTVIDLVIPETGERKGGKTGKRKGEQYGMKSKKARRNRLPYIPGILGGIRKTGHELDGGIRTKEEVIEENI